MNISEIFPSNFLKAADLDGQIRRLTIDHVELADLGQGEQKPVLYFREIRKGLVLNKTNSMLLAASFSPETDDWQGRAIELYSEKVPFQGRIVDAIRAKALPPPAATAATDEQAPVQQELNW